MKKLLLITIAQSDTSEMMGANIFAAVVIFLIIFFILRWFMLWYWKVNVIVGKQDEQIKEQKITNELLRAQIQLLGQNAQKEDHAQE